MENTTRERTLCFDCGHKPQMSNGTLRGQPRWKRRCRACHAKAFPNRKADSDRPDRGSKTYRKHKADDCQQCGFKPKHSCQLDVDHVDGNRRNNDPANLQTLCANCHRLKTRLAKDGFYAFHSRPDHGLPEKEKVNEED